MIDVREYIDGSGKSPFSKWLRGLNVHAAAKVTTALERIADGNLSTVKPVGSDVLSSFSPEIVRKLPRYPVVPAVLLGRLAVARHYQGQGLGGILLADALRRPSRAEFGVFAMVVDAKDEAAQRFYEHHGFTILAGETRRLCLPLAAAQKVFLKKSIR